MDTLQNVPWIEPSDLILSINNYAEKPLGTTMFYHRNHMDNVGNDFGNNIPALDGIVR